MEVDQLDLPQPGENAASPKYSPETAAHEKTYSTAGEKMVPTRGDPAATDDDGASILSTSSKSSFWPSLRRRAADKPPTSAEKEQPKSAPGEAAPDDDATGLDLETELELQKEGKDGGRWGIGDDARMNLE